jgi:O-antigen ligase
MRDFQDLLSLGPLYRQRAAGFALEPSWLAHMLNMLYLPMWLSAAISGYSVFSFRIFKKISTEMALLALGVLTLILTLSRVGWITFFCMAAFLVIKWNIHLVRWLQKRFAIPENRRIVSTAAITLALVIIYIGVIIAAAYGMSRVDPRMADLFRPQFWQLNNLNRYANALQFGERVVYWQAGWEVFNQHPMLGVGLGNSGRWFAERIPSYGMNLIEVRQLLYRSMDLPNSKNLWVRILAETGIVGFAFYSAWLISVLKRALTLYKSHSAALKMAGYWGIFIFIGIIFEGFSIDSFAMPYFWISAGFVLAASRIGRNNEISRVALEEK